MKLPFVKKYENIVKKNNSLICVGLDQPNFLKNKEIISQTNDLVCAYKPNLAFYLADGIDGLKSLKKTIEYIQQNFFDVPIILDAKFGDIDNTSKQYAKFAFEYLNVDALTLNPYLGYDALQPFLSYKEKGQFILCKTSNPGSSEFQDKKISGQKLFELIGQTIVRKWNINKNCMLVVGATYTRELADIRKIVGDTIILIPGVGAQRGNINPIIEKGLNSKKAGLIISASRSVLNSSTPRLVVERLRNEITSIR